MAHPGILHRHHAAGAGSKHRVSLVSRSRNRSSIRYHIIASIFSNGVWYATFSYLVVNKMPMDLFIPYTVGTVTGSVWGVKISMWIEKILHAESDSHLVKK
jgi:hypothetical protein